MYTESWSNEELEYLKKHWMEKRDEEMAEELGRTALAVCNKRKALKLKRSDGPPLPREPHHNKKTKEQAKVQEPELDNMKAISRDSLAAQECGMHYGKYYASTPAERERARAEYQSRQKEERRNPWAISVKV